MSRSGEIFKPWRTISSPVLTMMVSKFGSITSYRPRRSFEAPTPPASAVIFIFLFVGIERSDASGVGGVTSESIGVGYGFDSIADARTEEFVARNEFGVEREAFTQRETAGLSLGLQMRDLRPGGFGIDEIFCDGGNAAPIVDAGFKQGREIVVAEIGRGLNIHVGT